MQYPQPLNLPQLPLFQEALWADTNILLSDSPEDDRDERAFSEISLRGLPSQCLTLLAPLLRELSEESSCRWLTLIAPPAKLTFDWLRQAGLNREHILLLPAQDQTTALTLACEALRLGNSHTVVSWLNLSASARGQLSRAAIAGWAQSLNIRMS